jgi:hypothetical protein
MSGERIEVEVAMHREALKLNSQPPNLQAGTTLLLLNSCAIVALASSYEEIADDNKNSLVGRYCQ